MAFLFWNNERIDKAAQEAQEYNSDATAKLGRQCVVVLWSNDHQWRCEIWTIHGNSLADCLGCGMSHDRPYEAYSDALFEAGQTVGDWAEEEHDEKMRRLIPSHRF